MILRRSQSNAVRYGLGAGLSVVLFALGATAQVSSPAPTEAEAVPPAPAASASSPSGGAIPGYRPGFVDAFGRWVSDVNTQLNSTLGSVTNFGSQAGSAAKDVFDGAGGVARTTAEATKDAADVTLGAAGTLGRLPLARIVSAREPCAMAPNGAPDCRVAAEAICRANGYNSGSSVDFETAEHCTTEALLARRRGETVHCPVESSVTRALCQ